MMKISSNIDQVLRCDVSWDQLQIIEWYTSALEYACDRIKNKPISHTIEGLDKEIVFLKYQLNKQRLKKKVISKPICSTCKEIKRRRK